MIGKQIKKLRILKGLSVYRLSQKAKVKQGIIARIEKGGGANSKTLEKIASAMDAKLILTDK